MCWKKIMIMYKIPQKNNHYKCIYKIYDIKYSFLIASVVYVSFLLTIRG